MMKKGVRSLLLLGATASFWSGQASAVEMLFKYETSFNATVTPVTTKVKGSNHLPYIDPDAAGRRLNGYFQLTIEGSYDTDDIQQTVGGETVFALDPNISSNVFGTILYYRKLYITKSSNGNISFSLSNIPLDLNFSGEFTKIFAETIITAESTGQRGTATSQGLSQDGTFLLYGETFANLYGVQRADLPEHYYNRGEQYLKFGANVAKGKNSDDFIGGTFSVFTAEAPPMSAVPEPTTWALMISGFGITGSAMRRKKMTTRVI